MAPDRHGHHGHHGHAGPWPAAAPSLNRIRLQRHGTLPDRLRDRRNPRPGDRDGFGFRQHGHDRARGRARLPVRVRVHDRAAASGGLAFGSAWRLAFAADTISIAIMEVVDNLIMLAIPGAMDAPLSSPLFWGSLAVALVIAGACAFPVNRWLISRGRGHALVQAHHGGH